MISKDKQYKTRFGHEVRIYSTDSGGEYAVHGAFRRSDNDEWEIMKWPASGKVFLHRQDDFDLVEVKPIKTSYVNIYPQGFNRWHLTKEDADKFAHNGRIACVKVTYTEGQFDD